MQRKIEYAYPGSFFPEYASHTVDDDTPDNIPERAYAYRYYELPDVPESTEDYEVRPRRKNESPWHYPGAVLLRISDIEVMNHDGRYDILISNMRGNGWEPIVKTRLGNFVPYEEGDVIE